MARPARIDPDEIRSRIIEVAEEQFRRVGYAKTAVSDIAGALAMSPANIYRFFPSKGAINEAICERCMREMEDVAWNAVRSKGSATERLEKLAIDVHRYNKANLLKERRMHDMVAAAIEENWGAIQRHAERTYAIVEFLLREGIATGEFQVGDVSRTARTVKSALMMFWHPQLLEQCMDDDVEAQTRDMARLLARALASRG